MPNETPIESTPDVNRDKIDITQQHAAILREQGEPEDGFEALPTTWLLCMLALALVSGWYFGTYTADFSAGRLDGENMSGASAPIAAAPKPVLDPKVVGKRVYNNCMACHQADGKGLRGQFPPLANSEWVLGNPEALARILLHGLQGDLKVLDEHYNGVMPAWQRFSDDDIAAVLTYIRQSFGNAQTPVLPELIAQVRLAEGRARGAWSQDELRKLNIAP